MGAEFGQTGEWDHHSELSWGLLEFECHRSLRHCVSTLNHLLRKEPALYARQFDPSGFEWIDLHHRSESIMVYRRRGKKAQDDLMVILNMTPVVRMNWSIEYSGEPYKTEIFNSDSADFWGSGKIFNPSIRHEWVDKKAKRSRLIVNLPALSGIVLK
jgi:1,4-alpha-glucan branching enzyme